MNVELYKHKNGSVVIEFDPPLKPEQEIDQLTEGAMNRFVDELMKTQTEKESKLCKTY